MSKRLVSHKSWLTSVAGCRCVQWQQANLAKCFFGVQFVSSQCSPGSGSHQVSKLPSPRDLCSDELMQEDTKRPADMDNSLSTIHASPKSWQQVCHCLITEEVRPHQTTTSMCKVTKQSHQISAFSLHLSPLTSSGAAYAKVPRASSSAMWEACTTCARPTSATFAVPSLHTHSFTISDDITHTIHLIPKLCLCLMRCHTELRHGWMSWALLWGGRLTL